jgi:Xaa-Pro aminopeptidase
MPLGKFTCFTGETGKLSPIFRSLMKPTEFKRRRNQLMKMMGKNTIAILPSAREIIRNRDAHFPFRQDSDFLYLTGFNEPDAVMVLIPGRKHGEYILFCREKDPEQETWNGRRAGQEGAVEVYGADDSFPIDDIDDILPVSCRGCWRAPTVFITPWAAPRSSTSA